MAADPSYELLPNKNQILRVANTITQDFILGHSSSPDSSSMWQDNVYSVLTQQKICARRKRLFFPVQLLQVVLPPGFGYQCRQPKSQTGGRKGRAWDGDFGKEQMEKRSRQRAVSGAELARSLGLQKGKLDCIRQSSDQVRLKEIMSQQQNYEFCAGTQSLDQTGQGERERRRQQLGLEYRKKTDLTKNTMLNKAWKWQSSRRTNNSKKSERTWQ